MVLFASFNQRVVGYDYADYPLDFVVMLAFDVDLVIRTGGSENRRLSNFLPWQSVYSELFFSDLLWPEFDEDEFHRALEYFASVKRRLGK